MRRLLYALGAASVALLGQLPDLKIEATDGGSVLILKNTSTTQPMTAFLIELVDYPGSSYALSHDEIATGGKPLMAGQQRRIPIVNMTIGAAPDYVKVMAAIFADGSSAGADRKVAELVERRRLYLSTVRDLVDKIGKSVSVGELQKWSASIPESSSKTSRAKPEVLNPAMVKSLIWETAEKLKKQPAADVVKALQATEAALAASKPAL